VLEVVLAGHGAGLAGLGEQRARPAVAPSPGPAAAPRDASAKRVHADQVRATRAPRSPQRGGPRHAVAMAEVDDVLADSPGPSSASQHPRRDRHTARPRWGCVAAGARPARMWRWAMGANAVMTHATNAKRRDACKPAPARLQLAALTSPRGELARPGRPGRRGGRWEGSHDKKKRLRRELCWSGRPRGRGTLSKIKRKSCEDKRPRKSHAQALAAGPRPSRPEGARSQHAQESKTRGTDVLARHATLAHNKLSKAPHALRRAGGQDALLCGTTPGKVVGSSLEICDINASAALRSLNKEGEHAQRTGSGRFCNALRSLNSRSDECKTSINRHGMFCLDSSEVCEIKLSRKLGLAIRAVLDSSLAMPSGLQ